MNAPQQYPLPVPAAAAAAPAARPSTMAVAVDLSQDAPAGESATTKANITKDQLKDYLRQWVRVENEISTLNAEIKKRKLLHQELSTSLLGVMRQNEIDCFDLANGRIVYSKTKTRAPLNNGQIKTALTTYYKDDVERATNLTQFLLASRVERTRESIKMKIPKNK
jgi:hypothetical protein